MTDNSKPMTRAERAELGSLIRKREKVMKAAAAERAAAMLADFEKQCAAIYSFDDDAVWQKAVEEAKEAVEAAKESIAERCRTLGIPKEFAPELYIGWSGRGQNAMTERRNELRRVAKTKIAAVEKEAITKIERESLEAQTQVLALGLESQAARDFLERMPPVEKLMPSINAVEIKSIVEAKQKERRHYDA